MCAIMLEDALKDEGLEGRLRVRDVVEIVAEAMGP
jgi:Fe-S oxidoreductase